MPEEHKDFCEWEWRHGNKIPANTYLRINCPNYPTSCTLFKIIAVCKDCAKYIEGRLKEKRLLYCDECDTHDPPSSFWTLYGGSS